MQTDKQLVDEILAGRTEKFGILAERYQQQIYRFLRGMSLDHDEAADVLQSALIRAYEKLDTLRGGETVPGMALLDSSQHGPQPPAPGQAGCPAGDGRAQYR